jgi:hypothetical protein
LKMPRLPNPVLRGASQRLMVLLIQLDDSAERNAPVSMRACRLQVIARFHRGSPFGRM